MRKEKIAVLGDSDITLAFKAIGMNVYNANSVGEASEKLRLLARNYSVIFITEDLAVQIEEQIAKLQQQRPAKIEQLKAARALGDLSENTEYSTAKRELRHLESRLRYLNKQLQYAEIVTPKNDHTIDLGTTVTIEFEDDHEQETYHIVGKQEADLAKQKISFDSPLGQALLHKTAGTTVTVEAPQSSYKVKIVKVEL